VCLDEITCGNPVMAFQIKKRINTELFIDRTAALYIGETQIRVVINEGNQPGVPARDPDPSLLLSHSK